MAAGESSVQLKAVRDADFSRFQNVEWDSPKLIHLGNFAVRFRALYLPKSAYHDVHRTG